MQKFWNLTWAFFLVSFLVGCTNPSGEKKELASFIPENSQTVLKIKNWGITSSDFENNNLLNQLEDESFSTFFKTKKSIFEFVKPSGKVLLCKEIENDSTQHFTLITKVSPNLFALDSIEGVSQTAILYNGKTINKTTFNSVEAFSLEIDSVFILSTSEVIAKNSFENKTNTPSLFSKAFKLKNDNELAYVQKLGHLKENDTTNYDLGSFASFELQILPDGIVGSGVVLTQDSLPQLLSIFKGQIPQKNDAVSIAPVSAKEVRSFTFSDARLLEKTIREYRKDSIVIDALFESINEIVSIQLTSENIVALKSLDTQITWDYLAKYISEKESFREIQLFDFNDEAKIFKAFNSLIPSGSLSVVFQWEDFIIFSENNDTAKKLISELRNNAVLANAPYFESANAQLAEASSLAVYSLQGNVSSFFSSLLGANPSQLSNFPLATTQYIYDRNFAHLNFVCKETSGQSQSTGLVNQLLSITLDREILGTPKFFTNHNTSGKDIVAQDISNVLYFISSNGKTLWKKQLDGAILGGINEVDLLRNGKKQLAFSTKSTLYVLDRNGKNVAPFPKKFKAPITQPVSVFDYDNNRKYRFVICQDNDILMYNSKAEIVTGFKFDKTESTIVLPPQHIRIGNKDYILIAEENGKLNILSRVGKERIKLTKTFDFSETPIAKEGSSFIVITASNSKKSISQKGEVTTQALQVSNDYSFLIEGTTKVTLDDHLLRINGLLVELPLGIYAKPQIFRVNKKTYIAVTELKENKVYLYHKDGSLVSNFPIYGTSQIDLADANKNKKFNVLVKGEPKEIILYQTD